MNGWGVFATSIISTIGAVALLGFILKSWLQTRLAESVRAEYVRQLAMESHQREIRMKAEKKGSGSFTCSGRPASGPDARRTLGQRFHLALKEFAAQRALLLNV